MFDKPLLPRIIMSTNHATVITDINVLRTRLLRDPSLDSSSIIVDAQSHLFDDEITLTASARKL